MWADRARRLVIVIILAFALCGSGRLPAAAPPAGKDRVGGLLKTTGCLEHRSRLLRAVKPLPGAAIGLQLDCARPDANRRIKELLNASEGRMGIEEVWKGIRWRDQSSQLVPERVHGGIE